MIQMRYIANLAESKDSIVHAQDAYTRRLNYDANKRRERYLRDRDAGKTGYKGIRARTSNPYGNYASLYYNPEKAAEYYRLHKKNNTTGSLNNKSKASGTSGSSAGQETGAAGGGSGSGGSGSGGSSGSGSGGAGKAIQDAIKKLQESSRFETEAQRKATQLKIESLRKQLAKKLKQKQKEREELTAKGTKEREDLKNKASSDIETAKNNKTKSIEKDKAEAKNKKESTVKPYREDNAKIRAQLDSMGKSSDPKKRAQLMRQLARNNDKINKANADYTDALFKSKTKHTNDMRNNIYAIQNKLYNARTASSAEQSSKLAQIRNEVADIRETNQKEIQKAREALNKWTTSEQKRVGKEVARLRGVPWEDPAKSAKQHDKKVLKRAKEILNGSKSVKTSSTKSSKSTKK